MVVKTQHNCTITNMKHILHIAVACHRTSLLYFDLIHSVSGFNIMMHSYENLPLLQHRGLDGVHSIVTYIPVVVASASFKSVLTLVIQ